MKKNLLLTVLVAAALVLTGCYKKSSEPVDELGFAKQVISALANDNEAFFQERLMTIDDWDALIECEALQEGIKEKLDSGKTIEDLKEEFIEELPPQEKLKKSLHSDYLEVQSDLRSAGIDLKKLKIIKCYTKGEGNFVIELEGDSIIYEFKIEAVKLSNRWVISGEIRGFSEK